MGYFIKRRDNHSRKNIKDSIPFISSRRRRGSETGLIASDFDEAARARSDGLRKADQLRLHRQYGIFGKDRITIIPMNGQPRMLTARQFAAAREVAYTTVINWLNEKLLIGAEKEAFAYDGFKLRIPEDAETHELKPGPKPKPTKKAAAKKGAK